VFSFNWYFNILSNVKKCQEMCDLKAVNYYPVKEMKNYRDIRRQMKLSVFQPDASPTNRCKTLLYLTDLNNTHPPVLLRHSKKNVIFLTHE
jgi:hypothetical protein